MKARFNQFAGRQGNPTATWPSVVIAALAACPTMIMAGDINKSVSFTGSAEEFVGIGGFGIGGIAGSGGVDGVAGNYGDNNRLQIGVSATSQTFIIDSGILTDGAMTLPPNPGMMTMNIQGTTNTVTFTGSSTQVIITDGTNWRNGGTGNGSFHLMGTNNTMKILNGATFTANGWSGIDGTGNTLKVDGVGSKATFSANGSDGFGNSQGSDQYTTNRVNITNGGAVYVNDNGIHNLVANSGAGNYAVNVDGAGGRSVLGVTAFSHNGSGGGGIAHIFNGGALETNADGGSNANQFNANSQPQKIFIDGGVISYRNATAARMDESTAGNAAGFTYAGNNAMRLNNSAAIDTGSYTLANNVGANPAKNYTRLEMINGTTSVARAIEVDGDFGGSMVFDNTTASITNGVTLWGAAILTATGNPSTLTGVLSGVGGVVKNGSGTLTLNSQPTYYGDTTIEDGTLSLVSPNFNAASTLIIGLVADSPAVLDLPAGTYPVTYLQIDGLLMPDGLYDSTNSGGAITGAGKIQAGASVANYTLAYGVSGLHGSIVGTTPQTVASGSNGNEVTATPDLYYYFAGWSDLYPTAARTDLNVTGDLSVTASFAINYTSWAAAYSIVGQPKGDKDNDGVSNAVEMVVGGNPDTGMDVDKLPTLQLVADPGGTIPNGNYMLFTYRHSTLSSAANITTTCQYNTDLGAVWATAANDVDNVKVITTPNHYALGIDRVQVYVPRAANTKMFGRLDVIVPAP
jgi:autotransporter-associated beta strand protein